MTQEDFVDLHDGLAFEGGTDRYTVVEEKIVDQRRWVTIYQIVFKDEETGRFYRYYFERGSTEYQDSNDPEVSGVVEVFPKEVTTIKYVTADKM